MIQSKHTFLIHTFATEIITCTPDKKEFVSSGRGQNLLRMNKMQTYTVAIIPTKESEKADMTWKIANTSMDISENCNA